MKHARKALYRTLREVMEAAKPKDLGFYYCRYPTCQFFHLTSHYDYWEAVRRMVKWRLKRQALVAAANHATPAGGLKHRILMPERLGRLRQGSEKGRKEERQRSTDC